MKRSAKSIIIKIMLLAASVSAIAAIAGCASGFLDPYDISNAFYEYTTVSGSDGKYIVITGHIVSQTDVRIPDTIYDIPVREVADSVFAGDTGIRSVTFGKNMRRVGSNAFGGCTGLQSVTFNVSMTDIGDYAFQECTSLTGAVLPQEIASLGRGAFYKCSALTQLTIPVTLTHIGGRAFEGTAWLTGQSENEFVIVGSGVLIAYNGDSTEVAIPGKVTEISGAFAGNTAITSVRAGKNLTSVGDMAFMGCQSLTSFSLPSSVTSVGSQAFFGCTRLKELRLSGVSSIGADAFANCGASLFVRQDSDAEKYCKDNGLDYFIVK